MMHQEHSKYTSFSGPFGDYKYIRMPLGLKNAPATFIALMDAIIASLQGIELFVYLDESKKCQFSQREANFLGHIVDNGKIRMDPMTIETLQ